MRALTISMAWFLLAGTSAFGQPPSGSTIRERVEVREAPVLVDVPAAWRGEAPARLSQRLVALENGAAREISALQAVAGPEGPGYSKVEIGFDTQHCQASVVRDAALALADAAGPLVALGPVEIAGWTGAGLILPSSPMTDAEEVAVRLTARAKEAGCLSRGLEVPERQPVCPGTPCLLIWVAAGWGAGPDAEAAVASAAESARELAAGGWTVLAFAPVAPPVPPTYARKPETRPGDDRSSWTINLLDLRGARERGRAQQEAQRATDLGLAPLARVAAATAGELAATTDELGAALTAIGSRSLLYYRTDRAVGGQPVSFELRAAGDAGQRLRAAEWAPALRP
jgi:hypothetical protein